MAGVDIHAFPPDLPPKPDTDDLDDGPERGQETPRSVGEALAQAEGQEGATGQEAASGRPSCDYCGGAAALGIYYLADGTKEWACYPCHAALIAQALHQAADGVDQAPAPA